MSHSRAKMPEVVLRQQSYLRWFSWFFTAFFAYVAIAVLVEDPPPVDKWLSATAFFAIFLLIGFTLSWRLWRLAVILGNSRMKVRGFFWNRTIPRSDVVGLTTVVPGLKWLKNGRSRWTPLLLYWAMGAPILGFDTHSELGMLTIRRWK